MEIAFADIIIGCSNSSNHQPVPATGIGDGKEHTPLIKFSFQWVPLYEDCGNNSGL